MAGRRRTKLLFPPTAVLFYSGTKALGEEVLGWREADRGDEWPAWEHENEPTGYVWRLAYHSTRLMVLVIICRNCNATRIFSKPATQAI